MFSNHSLYIEDIESTAGLALDWGKLKDSSVLISGASGLIGTVIVDVIMHKNIYEGLNCKIYALGRNLNKARERFSGYLNDSRFTFTAHDVNAPLPETFGQIDYVLHLASNTHPRDYASDPVGTILTNITGLNNLLAFSVSNHIKRFMFASSVEVYGENRGDTEYFDEHYCGFIDIAKARSGYPEAKRCGETLCQSYAAQYGLDVVIPRLPRTYGATMQADDSKAAAQFIRKAVDGQDIVLKSEGTQFYSYGYAPDVVAGMFTVLFDGANGEAYNIADEASDITLRELAQIAADYSGRHVVFELPDKRESAGYSASTKAVLSGAKLKASGWRPRYDIRSGIRRTIGVLAAHCLFRGLQGGACCSGQ